MLMLQTDRWKRLAIPGALLFAITCLALLPQSWMDRLLYDRQLIEQGQWWRLFSAHFVHLGATHFAMNAIGLLLIAIYFSSQSNGRRWLTLSTVSALVISAGVYVFSKDVEIFGGLSGLLHSYLFAFTIANWRTARFESGILFIVMSAKIIYEFFSGDSIGTEEFIGGPVLIQAHVLGAITGIIMGGFWWKKTA